EGSPSAFAEKRVYPLATPLASGSSLKRRLGKASGSSLKRRLSKASGSSLKRRLGKASGKPDWTSASRDPPSPRAAAGRLALGGFTLRLCREAGLPAGVRLVAQATARQGVR